MPEVDTAMSYGSSSMYAAGGDGCPPRASGAALSFRLATTQDEREAIYRLRYEVYALENGFRPPGPDSYRAWEDASDTKATHLYALADGKLIGALRILSGADTAPHDETSRAYDLARFDPCVPREKMAIAGRFALKREYRAGTTFLQLFIESARLQKQRGVELSFGDSPLALLPLYTSLGFQTYQAPYHHPVAGTLLPFVLVSGDLEYLRQIQSPIVAIADASTLPLDQTARPCRTAYYLRALTEMA
jgi:predicted GNAT family N-acyltransferase